MAEAFARSADDVVKELGVDPQRGLDRGEVERRRKEHGPNRLRQKRRKSAWTILVDQFKSLIFLLLAAAAAASFAFGELVQGAAIVVAMLINAAIGFFTEWRAVRSMEALRKLERIKARVRRGGEEQEVPAEELVPGDIVPLEAGDLVPADLRLTEAQNLRCDEASLTGESVPVGKTTEALDDEPPLAERENMAFKGTSVTNGSGLGVVVGIGKHTELGRISELAEEAEEEETPLEQRLDQLARRLLVLILVIAAVTAAVGVIAGRDLLLMVETGIALVVAAVPEGLPIVASIALARGMWRLARRNALIEKLSAVETMGGTNVICSDKTGTLTENRMTLSRLALADGEFELEQEDEPRFSRDGEKADVSENSALRAALEVAAFCNGATLGKASDQDERGTGDPMEIALLAGAAAAGIERDDLVAEQAELRREEFNPEVKMMATYHRAKEEVRVAVTGAPEAVISACTRVLTTQGEQDLDDKGREHWRERNEDLARRPARLGAGPEVCA